MGLGDCRFFTLTSPANEDADTSYAKFPERFRRFYMRLDRRFGRLKRIEYIAVVERQKRGAAHVHVIYRGPFIPQQWLSQVAAECGFGRIADIRRSRKDHVRYLAKYLAKDLSDPTAAPPRYFRRVRWSRGWCVWEKHEAAKFPEWWIVDAPPAIAALAAARQGFKVEEVVDDGQAVRFDRHHSIHWLRNLIGYRPASPLSPDLAS
jgi:hypothetical protein